MQNGTKIRQMKRPSRTDWTRVDAMKDSDIDFSDVPELGPDFFKSAVLWRPKEDRNGREGDAHTLLGLKEVVTDVPKVKTPSKPQKRATAKKR
jgi:hypothetical protein